jgi:hypothetical protein
MLRCGNSGLGGWSARPKPLATLMFEAESRVAPRRAEWASTAGHEVRRMAGRSCSTGWRNPSVTGPSRLLLRAQAFRDRRAVGLGMSSRSAQLLRVFQKTGDGVRWRDSHLTHHGFVARGRVVGHL